MQRHRAMKDVAGGQRETSFEFERRQQLAMQDRCAEIWRVSVDRVDATFGECVTAFVPVAARELVRRVLHEQLRDVMAGWRQRRVDRGRQIGRASCRESVCPYV